MKKLSFETQHEEVDSEGSWAVSYGDMITLLLTFFILFFSVHPNNDAEDNLKLKISLMETLAKTSSQMTGYNEQLDIGKEKKHGIDPKVVKEWGGLIHDEGNHVIVEFPGVSFFNTGSIDVTNKGTDAIRRFVEVYTPYAAHYKIGIRAFADKRRVRADKHFRFKDNLELTALRSVATLRVLQKYGIPLSKIKLGGYGEHLTTATELNQLPASKRSPSSELDLARKVVLVIEQEEKNEKKQ